MVSGPPCLPLVLPSPGRPTVRIPGVVVVGVGGKFPFHSQMETKLDRKFPMCERMPATPGGPGAIAWAE
jgi:hypothetical protein